MRDQTFEGVELNLKALRIPVPLNHAQDFKLPMNTSAPVPGPGAAFAKGGCGCLILFLVVGFLVVALGGSMHIDLGGALILFLIGGVLGLIVLAIYNKGRMDPR
jgi:hypothetical protein